MFISCSLGANKHLFEGGGNQRGVGEATDLLVLVGSLPMVSQTNPPLRGGGESVPTQQSIRLIIAHSFRGPWSV